LLLVFQVLYVPLSIGDRVEKRVCCLVAGAERVRRPMAHGRRQIRRRDHRPSIIVTELSRMSRTLTSLCGCVFFKYFPPGERFP